MGEKLKELAKRPVFWVIVAAVAVFAIWRGRSARVAAPQAGEPAPSFMGGGGGGGGFPVQGGQSIQDRLAELDLLSGQQQLAREKAQSDLSQAEMQRRFNLMGPIEEAQAALEKAGIDLRKSGIDLRKSGIDLQATIIGRQKETAKSVKMTCPVGEPKVNPETGQLYCRTPAGGGFRPFKQVGEIIQGVLQGAANAAPGVTEAYIGRQTGTIPRVRKSGGSSRSEQGMNTRASGSTGFFGTNPLSGVFGDQG